MTKSYSRTRDAYDERYQLMRIAHSNGVNPYSIPVVTETHRAAVRSYDNSDGRMIGWISLVRRDRFYSILRRVYAERGEIPF